MNKSYIIHGARPVDETPSGRRSGMASFMSKKKKYKFQVDVCVEELIEVPFVSAVLFAKLRLLDGGNFQDHSQREEVKEHTVKWNAPYTFPCKMLAQASTGILERCVLRISIRKESKGGKSFTKLGFVDFNLAEFAGAGYTCRKALLEGYDTRRRQDNSMLKISIKMKMLTGDILFKVPSPTHSSKHNVTVPRIGGAEDTITFEPGSGSLAGSIGSGSSGFGSLTKKRPALSDLVSIGQTLNETSNVPITVAIDNDHLGSMPIVEDEGLTTAGQDQQGHSRNSSNTSQMSKASGYSSIHSHSRQSSSGDSGHIRDLGNSQAPSALLSTPSAAKSRSKRGPILTIPSSFPELTDVDSHNLTNNNNVHKTPEEAYATPRGSITPGEMSAFYTPDEVAPVLLRRNVVVESRTLARASLAGILRSKSDFEIPRDHVVEGMRRAYALSDPNARSGVFSKFSHVSGFQFKSDALRAFLTPMARRRFESTPVKGGCPMPPKNGHQQCCTCGDLDVIEKEISHISRMPQRKHLISPDTDDTKAGHIKSASRRPSVTLHPSSSSLVVSETGSLDRAKAAFERRKKTLPQEPEVTTTGRVEGTRVNPDHLIDELIKNTKLDQTDESAESSGLQLFIAKDGTAALGSHEVKSQMFPPGVFTQVLMDDNR